MYKLHPDGRRDHFVLLESGVLTLSGGSIDIVQKDREGNIIVDTRSERIDRKKTWLNWLNNIEMLTPFLMLFWQVTNMQ